MTRFRTGALSRMTVTEAVSHLSPFTAAETQNSSKYLEQAEKVTIFITEPLAKHQSADDVTHGPSHAELGVKGNSWKKQNEQITNISKISVIRVHETRFLFVFWGGWNLTPMSHDSKTAKKKDQIRCWLWFPLTASSKCLLSSCIHSSILLRPIPKSRNVVSVNRRSCFQRSPLLIVSPKCQNITNKSHEFDKLLLLQYSNAVVAPELCVRKPGDTAEYSEL